MKTRIEGSCAGGKSASILSEKEQDLRDWRFCSFSAIRAAAAFGQHKLFQGELLAPVAGLLCGRLCSVFSVSGSTRGIMRGVWDRFKPADSGASAGAE